MASWDDIYATYHITYPELKQFLEDYEKRHTGTIGNKKLKIEQTLGGGNPYFLISNPCEGHQFSIGKHLVDNQFMCVVPEKLQDMENALGITSNEVKQWLKKKRDR